jgi:hypothetical protein
MLEREIAEILHRYPREVWPDVDFTFVGREQRLTGGLILDLCFRDETGIHWIVELKRDRVTEATVAQVVSYLDELRRSDPDTPYRGIVAAPTIGVKGRAAAYAADVLCRRLDVEHLTAIAAAHGVLIGHEGGQRPVVKRSPRSSNRSKTVTKHRPATPADVITYLRLLDARFPPGTLTAPVSLDVIREYWDLATPEAPVEHRSTAADLTFEALTVVLNSTVSTRSSGRSDPYTTLRSLDGRVVAAIDARRTYVKLDFPLPESLAEESRGAGLLRIWKPRGYSVWCQSRVGTALTPAHAVELLRAGLRFEFGTE